MIWIASPKVGYEEMKNVMDVIRSGMLVQGKKVEEFENEFSKKIGARYSIACSSGTAALHMAFLSLGIGTGDEVITTPFTFVATINMIKVVGAIPVFVDIKDNYNINEELIEAAITDKTKAIVPVHMFGNPCNMNVIMKIADKYKLKVIEDCAQSYGAKYNEHYVGVGSDIGCFSFYPSKIMTTGEGGMCVTDDNEIAKKLRYLRNHGMEGSSYDYKCLGFNYKMTDIAAAIGLVQLSKVDRFILTRRDIARSFNFFLDDIIDVPQTESYGMHVYNNYSFNVKNRDLFILNMKANGIDCRVYYPKSFADLPKVSKICKEVVSIPIRPNLTDDEINHIVCNVRETIKNETNNPT